MARELRCLHRDDDRRGARSRAALEKAPLDLPMARPAAPHSRLHRALRDLLLASSNRFKIDPLDESPLPMFMRYYYWPSMFFFLCLSVGAMWVLVPAARGSRVKRAPAADGSNTTGFADLDTAWDDIRLRLDDVNIFFGSQNVFLILSPSEDRVAALIEASGTQVFASAPSQADAPIHAYATAEGIFLSLSGASSFGTGDQGLGAARLEHICRKLVLESPDCPVVRGVAVVFPIDWAARTDSVARSAFVRDDLRTIRQVTTLGLPVFALFTGMEAVPGFPEFTARLVEQVSPGMRDQRLGFPVPPSVAFSSEMVGGGLVWLSLWFHGWTLHLLNGRLFEHRGNAALVTLDHEFRRYRKRLRSILESAFSTHREAEPVIFRGCYFMATGNDRADRAFSSGLIRGPKSRIIAEATETAWAAEAIQEEKHYGKLALAIAMTFGLPCLLIWLTFIIPRFTLYGIAGLAAIGAIWAVVLIRKS